MLTCLATCGPITTGNHAAGDETMTETTTTTFIIEDTADSIASGLAELAKLHEAYMAELDSADEADAIAARMFGAAS
jgi:hypothetical protein